MDSNVAPQACLVNKENIISRMLFVTQTFMERNKMFARLTLTGGMVQDDCVGGLLGNRDEICKRFGKLLAGRRTESGMSQEAFAKAVGLSRTSITNIERGRQPISLHTLYFMADILGVEPADLLPPALTNTVALALTGEPESKLTSQEKEQLQKLSAKESSWLHKIAKSAPKKKGS